MHPRRSHSRAALLLEDAKRIQDQLKCPRTISAYYASSTATDPLGASFSSSSSILINSFKRAQFSFFDINPPKFFMGTFVVNSSKPIGLDPDHGEVCFHTDTPFDRCVY